MEILGLFLCFYTSFLYGDKIQTCCLCTEAKIWSKTTNWRRDLTFKTNFWQKSAPWWCCRDHEMIIYVSEKSYRCEADSYSSRRPGDQEVRGAADGCQTSFQGTSLLTTGQTGLLSPLTSLLYSFERGESLKWCFCRVSAEGTSACSWAVMACG